VSEQYDVADATEQAYRYGNALGIGPPAAGTRFDHTVIVMCDSTRGRVSRWTLIAKHGHPRRRRVRCPQCGRWARMELADG
jgi:hypothetical protein